MLFGKQSICVTNTQLTFQAVFAQRLNLNSFAYFIDVLRELKSIKISK